MPRTLEDFFSGKSRVGLSHRTFSHDQRTGRTYELTERTSLRPRDVLRPELLGNLALNPFQGESGGARQAMFAGTHHRLREELEQGDQLVTEQMAEGFAMKPLGLDEGVGHPRTWDDETLLTWVALHWSEHRHTQHSDEFTTRLMTSQAFRGLVNQIYESNPSHWSLDLKWAIAACLKEPVTTREEWSERHTSRSLKGAFDK